MGQSRYVDTDSKRGRSSMKIRRNSSKRLKHREVLRSIENTQKYPNDIFDDEEIDEKPSIVTIRTFDDEKDSDFEAVSNSAESSDSADESASDSSYTPSDDSSRKRRSFKSRNSPDRSFLDDSRSTVSRCKHCREPVDSLVFVSQFPADTKTESEMLKLDVMKYEYDESIYDKRPVKITNFCVFDKDNHLCSFDGDLITDSVDLYFFGCVKPMDDPGSEGFNVTKVGPIEEWWIEGLDEGKTEVIGFSTKYVHYYLMDPSDEYAPFMKEVTKKVWTLKLVIEFFQTTDDDNNLTYDNLLKFLKAGKPEISTLCVDENTLLEYRDFIYERAVSHLEPNEADDDDENKDATIIMDSLCMKKLRELVKTSAPRRILRGGRQSDYNYDREQATKCVKVTVTPLVESVFRSMFEKQMKKTNTDEIKMKPCLVVIPRLILPLNEEHVLLKTEPMMLLNKEDLLPDTKSITTLEEQTALPKMEVIKPTKVEDVLPKTEQIKLFKAEDLLPETELLNLPKESVKLPKEETATCNGSKISATCNDNEMNSQLSDDETLKKKLRECCIQVPRVDEKIVQRYMKTKKSIKLSKNMDAVKSTKKRRRSVMDADDEDDFSDSEYVPKKTRVFSEKKCFWEGEPIEMGDKTYFQSVFVGNERVVVGNFVTVNCKNNIAQIKYLWEDDGENMLCHVQWFMPSFDTVLGDVGNKKEVFLLEECDDIKVNKIDDVVSVTVLPAISEWKKDGNWSTLRYYTTTYYCQKKFENSSGTFKDFEVDDFNTSLRCSHCEKLRLVEEQEIPKLLGEIKSIKDFKRYHISAICWREEIFKKGTCVFLQPGTLRKVETLKIVQELETDYDEDKYPEKYRKKLTKDFESDLTEPLEIGVICAISSEKKQFRSAKDICVTLKKFYRPHNTHLDKEKACQLDLNLLYWSEEECVLKLDKIDRKCYVYYKDNIKIPVENWTEQGPFRFYFTEAYDRKNKAFISPPSHAKTLGRHEKNINSSVSQDQTGHDVLPEHPKIPKPLRSLDVFAGCGGLSDGLHQSGICETIWAVERCKAAAEAFKLNNKNAAVFSCDSSFILKMVMDGKAYHKGVKLPQKGDVELLCGGPPCQGFSRMNRFKEGIYSKFKNSLIVNYLSYCDFYRPKYFILENVRDFVSNNKGMILKMALSCLVSMGYQVAFAVLQCGKYGIPQSRRRTIILAAAPGEVLPEFPEPTHAFTLNSFVDITVDKKRYITKMQWKNTAPYRMVTVRDAISDLPKIKNNDHVKSRSYGSNPLTHFQKLARGRESDTHHMLTEHYCKLLSPIVLARIRFIPHEPPADWRDLPNIVVELENNVYTKKLKYTHNDIRWGKSSTGRPRGVCICASSKTPKYKQSVCQESRQANTLIPWCLPHTSARHNQWSGLYGRIPWYGWFRTVVTNPEPMGKQGRVLHPDQDRVVSVRETARSQGFRDCFQFYGKTLDKYAQVGNAVAPPLGKALGMEILKSVHAAESKLKMELDS